MTFEEILSCHVDRDDDYKRVKDGGLISTLDPVSHGLVLLGHPFGPSLSPSFRLQRLA